LLAASTADLLLARLTDREAHDFESVLRYGLRSLRPAQVPPPNLPWDVFLALAGRGSGKTHLGSRWSVRKALTMPGSRGAFVARTAADVRDTMIYGPSGLKSACPPWFEFHHAKTDRVLLFPNGTEVHLYSAEEPDLLRGPQFHWLWGDEFATWKKVKDEKGGDAWSNAQDGLRLGVQPQALLTTTPRPTDLVLDTALGLRNEKTGKRLISKEEMKKVEWWLSQHTKDDRGREHVHRTLIRRWRTEENAANLTAGFAAKRRARYGESPLGRQEMDAELLMGNDRALWTQTIIDEGREENAPHDSPRVRCVVAIDPTRSQWRPRDEAGIIVAAKYKNGHGYVLKDGTVRGSPWDWGTRALALANEYGADDILYESNRIDQSIRDTLQVVAKASEIRWVPKHSQDDKKARAEPVSALYYAKRVHHVNPTGSDGSFETFEELEHEMVNWDPADTNSPNRLDALVIALTDLMTIDRGDRKRVAGHGLGKKDG